MLCYNQRNRANGKRSPNSFNHWRVDSGFQPFYSLRVRLEQGTATQYGHFLHPPNKISDAAPAGTL